MRKAFIGLLGLTLASGLVISVEGSALASPGDQQAPAVSGPGDQGPLASKAGGAADDNLPNALDAKQQALRAEALHLVLTGQRKVQTINGSQVVRLGTKPAGLSAKEQARVSAGQTVKPRTVDQYVQLSREQTDKIFVVLTEFGNKRGTDIDPRYGDVDTDPKTPGPTKFTGPLHNQIPAPNRKTDNSTIWQKNYSAKHYRDLYFGTGKNVESLKTYYEKQSSGRYSVNGMVTDWVKVPYNEARYGRSNGFPCAGIVCSNTWALLKDGLGEWVKEQKKAGKSTAAIAKTLKSYDQQDRYDYDGDGNFNEPDGYIDHFQVVHAGGDQADGDPIQGEDAIWSHRWYAYADQVGTTGPSTNKLGGTQIGSTGLWVGDYTIQPENGGLSVFAHEYGHDLGLPDHYDTAGGPDNAVNWWTLMAQSRARAKNDVGIGTRPADLGAWDKLQLGWLDYDVAVAGQKKTYSLGPHEYNSKKAQGLVVILPKKEVTTTLVTPASGDKQWWSGSGDNLSSSLTREVSIPSAPAELSFQANYDIEEGFDYGQVQVDDGSGWKTVAGNISTTTGPANAFDGSSGGWVPATFDLSAYAGKTVQLRIGYVTDGGAAGNDENPGNNGLFVDDIKLVSGGNEVFADGAEDGANGWTAAGFTIVGSSVTRTYDHYYVASNRTYTSYDKYLQTGPYNFGFTPKLLDKVEFFPYQNGLLVNYWDTSQSDNNESQHPGQGLVLPVDSHPAAITRKDGAIWRGRIQTYDAPFSLERADSLTLHVSGTAYKIAGLAGNPTFDDTKSYWDPAQPTVGVKTPGVGVTLQVTKQSGTSMTVKLGTSTPVSSTATLASARSAN
ncbi:MAG: putative family peptidase [Friedmanniella sp.]|nr:putative family peptidase [Friedmanniella sp.]